MAVPSYITAQDVVDAISEPAYMLCFDDTNSGLRATVDASTQVQSVLTRTWAWVESWLPNIYAKLPPGVPAGVVTGGDTIPRLLKDAALQYAQILTWRRHPEVAKTYGAPPVASLMAELAEFMERIQVGVQRISPNDSPPEAVPQNIGGVAAADGARIAMSNTDGTTNTGDW